MTLAFRFGDNVEVITEGFFFQRKGVVVGVGSYIDQDTKTVFVGDLFTVSFSAQGADPVTETFRAETLKKLT